MSITKTQLQNIRQEMDSALAEIAAKHGMSMQVGKISYDDVSFKAEVKANVVSNDGTNLKAKNDWDCYCSMFNLDKSDFGSTFKQNGEVFEIVEIKPRNRKYPIIARNSKGQYKFKAETVREKLGK